MLLRYNANELNVDIEPDCRELKDHRFDMTVNGFNKDGNVYWEFIKSNGYMDYYGYFDTNATGWFDDYIFADGLYPEFGTMMLIYTSTLPYTHMMMV